MGGIEHRTQHIGGAANILDREILEHLPRRKVLVMQHALNAVVIFIGPADRVFKNRRV